MGRMPASHPSWRRPAPEDLTIDDLAAYLHVSKSSPDKLTQEGKVPEQKGGRHWRLYRETIDASLQNRWEGLR